MASVKVKKNGWTLSSNPYVSHIKKIIVPIEKNMDKNIQRAILSTFLWSNDLMIDTSDAFQLDTSLFKGDLYLIACKINETTASEDRLYGLLCLELQNTSQLEWMMLTVQEQTPLGFSLAFKYHNRLKEKQGLVGLKGLL